MDKPGSPIFPHMLNDTLGANLSMNATIGSIPIVSFFTEISPAITAVSALFAISWFARLWYLSIKEERAKKKNG
jgi:hypothetical protein